MLVAKREKIGKNYSKHLYLYDTVKDGMPNNKVLETNLDAETISDDPEEVFKVKLDSAGAYIVNKDGNIFDIGFSSKELRRFFYCQIV